MIRTSLLRKLKDVDAASGVTPSTVIDQGTATSVTIAHGDLNKVHRMANASAGTVALPSADAAHVGYWVEIRKRGAGNIQINRNGSDTIAGATSLSNTTASETWASIRLVIEEAGRWGIQTREGYWA